MSQRRLLHKNTNSVMLFAIKMAFTVTIDSAFATKLILWWLSLGTATVDLLRVCGKLCGADVDAFRETLTLLSEMDASLGAI
jgi:hypothetical protein